MEEEAGSRLWSNSIPSSKKKSHIPWTTIEVEQAIKLDSPESITGQHQKCTVDFFFLIITGNETENSNILILLYCYRTTLLEVLQ